MMNEMWAHLCQFEVKRERDKSTSSPRGIMKEKFQQQSGKMATLQELRGSPFASCTESQAITSSIVRPYCAAQKYSRVMWLGCGRTVKTVELGGTRTFTVLTGNVIKNITGKLNPYAASG
jgi:hypothetical protein